MSVKNTKWKKRTISELVEPEYYIERGPLTLYVYRNATMPSGSWKGILSAKCNKGEADIIQVIASSEEECKQRLLKAVEDFCQDLKVWVRNIKNHN